jgi:hypothetical protein
VSRIRSEAEEFLQNFTVDLYHYETHGRFGRLPGKWSAGLPPEAERILKSSDQWREFEEELLAVANHQAAQNALSLMQVTHQPAVPVLNGRQVDMNTVNCDVALKKQNCDKPTPAVGVRHEPAAASDAAPRPGQAGLQHESLVSAVKRIFGGTGNPTLASFYGPLGVKNSEFVAWTKQDHKHCGKKKRELLNQAAGKLE